MTPAYFSTSNARALACSSAASPVSAAAMCGTMPRVQPRAVAAAARGPLDSPAARVSTTPVPGVAITTREVSRNSVFMPAVCAGRPLNVLNEIAHGSIHQRQARA